MVANKVRDEALAAKVGVSRVQILRLRKGDNRPSSKTALRLQEVTGIPAAKFILGEAA